MVQLLSSSKMNLWANYHINWINCTIQNLSCLYFVTFTFRFAGLIVIEAKSNAANELEVVLFHL